MSERLIIVTTCDMCQLPGVGETPNPALIDVWDTVTVANRGIFVGDEEKARQAGWVDTDYGLLCPECAEAQKQQEEMDTLTGTDHGAIGLEKLEKLMGGEDEG